MATTCEVFTVGSPQSLSGLVTVVLGGVMAEEESLLLADGQHVPLYHGLPPNWT